MQIVSLTTDFGVKDYYVAKLKGQLLQQKRDLQIIDVSHHIAPYDIIEAAFFIKNIYRQFPKGSIHIVAVNNVYRKKSEYLVFEREEQFFIGPNNGVFSLLFEELTAGDVYLINDLPPQTLFYEELYARATGYVSAGLPLDEIGNHPEEFVQRLELKPVITQSQIRATIIYVDHYENVIVNLKKEEFDKIRNDRSFEIYYKQHDPINYLSRHYGDVAIGDPLAFFNSSGYLEIAINMGKACSSFNLHRNENIQINFY
jgi:S-adenosylmethionine hydrolase